jgi:hypothetical protein
MVDESNKGLLVMLLREGSERQAIELYQEQSGVDYRSAQREMRDLADRYGIPLRGHGFVSLAIIALAVVLGLVLSH